MFKRAIVSAITKSNPGVIADIDCSQFTSCGSCIAQEGCGFCGNIGSCVSGGWFGALDKSTCGLNDYYYHQCQMSTLPLGIITIVLISVVIIAVLIGMGILCCCICCRCCQEGDSDEDDEDRPLLGSNYLRRSSTYYQWNRQPPTKDSNNKALESKKTDQSSATLTEDAPNTSTSAEQTSKNWEDRRTALLKKYAREPSTNTTTTESTE